MQREHNKIWALGLFALLIGGGVGYGVSAASAQGKSMATRSPLAAAPRGEPLSEATNAALGREVASLRAELAAVMRRLDSSPRSSPASSKAEEGSRAVADATEEPDGRTPTEEADAAARRQRARLEAIEDGLQKEPTDAVWAKAAAASIQGAFKDGADAEIAGSSLKSVDCRSSLCRVNVTHADPGAFRRFMHEFHGLVGQELPRMTLQPERNADGSIGSVIYLARQGRDFPAPETSP